MMHNNCFLLQTGTTITWISPHIVVHSNTNAATATTTTTIVDGPVTIIGRRKSGEINVRTTRLIFFYHSRPIGDTTIFIFVFSIHHGGIVLEKDIGFGFRKSFDVGWCHVRSIGKWFNGTLVMDHNPGTDQCYCHNGRNHSDGNTLHRHHHHRLFFVCLILSCEIFSVPW